MKLNQLPPANYNPVKKLEAPKPGPEQTPEAPQDGLDKRAQRTEESNWAEKLSGLKKLGRPALAGALGLAAGAGITTLAAGATSALVPWLAPAIITGGILGAAAGTVGMPKEYGMFAGLGKMVSGVIHGGIGATTAFVAKSAVIGAGAGAGIGVAATIGATVVGLAGLGWGAAKLAEALTPRY
jgi:hypothetical protein